MTQYHPIPVIFYKEEGSEKEPVKEWLYSLDKNCRKIIGQGYENSTNRMAFGHAASAQPG
jgi:hypothetical protein